MKDLISSIFEADIIPEQRIVLLAVLVDTDENGFVDTSLRALAQRLGRGLAHITFKLTSLGEMNAISRLVMKDDSVRFQLTVGRLCKRKDFWG